SRCRVIGSRPGGRNRWPCRDSRVVVEVAHLVHAWNISCESGVCIPDEENTLMRDLKNDELLSRLQSGDERALSDLADTYGTKIFQLAFRYLRNKEDAEEVTQDVLFNVYRKVATFRGDAALSSWIYRITFNAAMSRLRTARFQRSQE